MKRVLLVAALFCALASPASASAAPGDPVDFELAAPAVSASSAGGPVTSRPVKTPRSFNLVGLRWRGSAEPRVRVRVRATGKRWTRWAELGAHADHNPDRSSGEREVAASDPVWVGKADHVQYRLSERVPGLRLHFVDVGSRARARAAQIAPPANPAPISPPATTPLPSARPAMVTREQWGAASCPPRSGPEYGTVKAAYVHHTVSLNDYAPEEAPSVVLAICRYHRNSNGWNDIGYNALVDKYGVLYEGRAGGVDQAVIGAQAEGYNGQSTGIASIGNNSQEAASAATMTSLARWIRWKLAVHGVPLTGTTTLTSTGGGSNRFPAGRAVPVPTVIGHRDTGATECPGNLLYAQLDDLRALVAAGVPLAGSGTSVIAYLSDPSIDYGEQVRVSGYLGGPDGGALAQQPIELQSMSDGTWKTLRVITTNPDGTYDTDVKPRKRMYLRVRFASQSTFKGSTSPKLLQRVRPVLALTNPVKRTRRKTQVVVTGTVTPNKRGVYVALQKRLKSGRYKRVGLRLVKPRRKVFTSSFVPEDRGRYRYYAIVKADLDTDRALSAYQNLTVTK